MSTLRHILNVLTEEEL